MEFTADKINNDKNLLPLLLKEFTMFKIKCWWNKKERYNLKQTVEKVSIRCNNYGKETMLDVDLLENDYQEIITTFVQLVLDHRFLFYSANILS